MSWAKLLPSTPTHAKVPGVKHVLLDIEAVTNRAAALGIDSVSELARRLNISQPHLARILKGDRSTLPSHVLAMAKALDIKPSALLDKSEADVGAAMDATAAEEVAS